MFKALLVVLVALVKLTVRALAMLVTPTTEEFAQDVPVEPSIALKAKAASMFADRTLYMILQSLSVSVHLDMVFSTGFVTFALLTISSAVDTV